MCDDADNDGGVMDNVLMMLSDDSLMMIANTKPGAFPTETVLKKCVM